MGSSSTSVTWAGTTAGQPYTFAFTGITLDSSTKYWFVFSEHNVDGDVANFRMRVNLTGSDGVAGPGRGYLVGDTAQAISATASGGTGVQDWGPAYVVVVPEPSFFALAGLGLGVLVLRWSSRKP